MRLVSRSTYLGLVSGVHIRFCIDEQFHQLLMAPGSCTIHWSPQDGIPEGGKVRGGEGRKEEGGGEGGREGGRGRGRAERRREGEEREKEEVKKGSLTHCQIFRPYGNQERRRQD